MRTLIFRDFSEYDICGNVLDNYGSIAIHVTKNNFLSIVIEKLNFLEIWMQAHMLIKYNENIDLYDNIIIVLDKISHDMHYKYNDFENYHKDFILHDHEEIKNPQIWIDDEKKHSRGNNWIPFTRENMEHITIEECEEDFETAPYSVIKGTVSDDGVFTYDYPIVDSMCPFEIYLESRGKIDYFFGYELYPIDEI